MLLGKLKAARKYTDIAVHGTMKLTAYFGVMSYCVVSRVERLMVSVYTIEMLLVLKRKMYLQIVNFALLFRLL